MTKLVALLVASVLMLTGCGGKERTIELERQKLTLELMKAQNEQLAALTKKESELRDLEKKNQEALREIERQQATLQSLGQETAQKERAFQKTVASETAKLTADRKTLENERETLAAEGKRVKAKEAELDRRLALIERAREAAQKAKEAERRAEEERRRRNGPITARITVPIATYFQARDRITFDIQVADGMRLYKANNGNAPKTHEEFMEKIIKENQIKLPELPPSDRYIYVPEQEQLCVEHTQN